MVTGLRSFSHMADDYPDIEADVPFLARLNSSNMLGTFEDIPQGGAVQNQIASSNNIRSNGLIKDVRGLETD